MALVVPLATSHPNRIAARKYDDHEAVFSFWVQPCLTYSAVNTLSRISQL